MEMVAKASPATAQWQELGPAFRQAVASTLVTMGQVALRFAPATPQEQPPGDAAQMDSGRLQAHVQELLELLQASDLRALEVHSTLPAASALGRPERVATLAALSDAMASFDFAAGVPLCESLIVQLQDGR
jgi:hypothetical protein